MSDFATIIDALSGHAKRNPTGIAYRFLKEGNAEPAELSYQQLFCQVTAVAQQLLVMVRPGERVLLMFPAGEAYIVAFLACLMAGCIAVPLYPPRPNQKMFRTNAVIEDCSASLILTNTQVYEVIAQLKINAAIADIPVLVTDNFKIASDDFVAVQLDPDSIAFLQYTSGSTGNPKGVMVSHRNLIENEKSIAIGFQTSPADICLNWLPMYHDMGLIGSVLQPLYIGCISILMTPSAFIRDPMCWLEAISQYKATKCGAANFAFELLCQRYDAGRAAKLDLSSIQLMFSGAEPVRAATLKRFSELYKSAGFSYNTFYPCYGMAEATLFITGSDHHHEVTVRMFDEHQLGVGRAELSTEDHAGKALTACGVNKPEHVVHIVDPQSCALLPAGQIGEIWFDGPSKAQGYWGKADAAAVFQARIVGQAGSYLRTGDLGFMLDGQLYITGRRKDLIIIHGRNYYPQDIEVTVAASNPAFNADNCAAFAVEVAGAEMLVVVQEIQRTAMRQLDKAAAILQIRTAVSVEHQLELYDVVLLKPGSLAKTTSGKVQRYRNRELYLAGEHQALASMRQADIQPELNNTLQQDPLLLLINQYVAVPAAVDDNTTLIALGLDSLKAATLCYALQQKYGLSIEFYELLNGMTLGQLRNKVLQDAPLRDSDEIPQAEQVTGADGSTLQLSVLQEQLWTAYMADPESSANNLAVAFAMDEHFDPAVLNQALALLCADFPMLRTHFSVAAGLPVVNQVREPVQLAYPELEVGLSFEQQVAALAAAPFDLFSQLPIRVQLLQTPDLATRVVLITLHHLIADYDAVTVLLDRLRMLYIAGTKQRVLPALARQAACFATQHQCWLAGPEADKAKTFWASYLADFNARLPLRTSRPRPAVRSFAGQSMAIALDASLSARIQLKAKQHGVTPFAFLLTIYAVTLSRLCDRLDFTIGVPFNCAAGTAAEQDIGYHINALPVRFQLTEQQSLAQMLAKVKHDLQLIVQHRQYPSEWIAQTESSEVNAAYAPLFQVLFSYYTARHQQINIGPVFLSDGYPLAIGDVMAHSVKVPRLASQFDLSLSLAECETGFVGELEFSTALFDPQAVAVWRDVFLQLCQQLTADDACLPFSVSMLSAAQMQQIRHWSIGRTLPAGGGCNPLRRILQHCESNAEQIAMISAEETITYREMRVRLEKITAGLLAQGVRPGERVAFYADRKVDTIILMFALVQVGAAFIPLDSSAPIEHLNSIVHTVLPKFIVVDCALEVPAFQAPLVLLADLLLHGQSTFSPWQQIAELLSNYSAYFLFTSGSTGVPKGVDVTYANLDYFIEWTLAYFDEQWFSNLLCATNFSFDVAMFETFSVLAAGGTLTLVQSILEMPDDTPIDAVVGTASSMYEALRGQRLRPAIARMILTGEAPDATTVRMLQTEYNIDQILNAYGPTESTIWSSIADITTAKERITNIGGPVPAAQNWVVDNNFNLVPPGVEGELLLGGDGITRGYLNQPQQTAASFVCDDFFAQHGQRLYRTGDRVYWDYDGQLIYLGRRDNQVNIRGYRIELSEVESALRSLPGVAQAVMVKHTQAGRDAMAGFVVCAAGVTLSESQVLRLLAEKLPVAMLPGVIKFLSALPINRNGKTDQKALRQSLQQPAQVTTTGHLRHIGSNQLLRYETMLPAGLHQQVCQLAERYHCRTASVYLAAYCVLLGRWFNNDALLVKVYQEIEAQQKVCSIQLTDSTFEQIMKQADTARDCNGANSAEYAFAFGYELYDFYAPVSTGLSLREQQGAILACWQFATHDWLGFSRESLMQAYQSVLQAACLVPKKPSRQLPLQCDESWQTQAKSSYAPRLVVAENDLSQAFRRQVLQHKHKPAIIQGAVELSYIQLDQRIQQCATALIHAGLGRGNTVAVCLGNQLSTVVAVFAVWQLGGCVVTIDPVLPAARIAYMLQDAAATACIVAENNTERYQHGGCFIVLDEQAQVLAVEQATTEQPSLITAIPLACVLYTSGSTGQPKGVMLSHDNILSYAAAAQQLYLANAQARVLQFSNVGFDIFLEELSLSLLSGATLVIPNETIKQDVQVFWSYIKTQQISVMSLPTAFWHLLVEQLDEAQAAVASAQLKTLITGGEAMSSTMLQRWHQWVSANTVALYNTYGPTEGTVIATAYRTQATHQTTTVPIGHAIGNTVTLVLDNDMRPVPLGAVGELYIAGRGVALGYLGRADLTAQAFVTNPFQPAERLYRTGDMVRHTGEQGLVYLGRQDHQIKISGYRVELAEIEVVIEAFHGVNRALVLGQLTDTQHKVLVAYVQWHDAAMPELLQAYLSEQLPAYMVPKQYVDVQVWPLTTNGKIDRNALPKAVIPASTVQYKSATEQQLAAIVEMLLGEQGLAVDRDFLSLGLNSMQAAKLLGEVRMKFQQRFDFRQLFEFSSIASLAAFIESRQGKPSSQSRSGEDTETMEIFL